MIGEADGSALLGGESALRAHFVKLGPTGAPDPSFGTNGIAAFDTFFAVRGVARQSTGKIVFAAWGSNVSFVVGRLEANGAIDKTFGEIGTGLVTVPIFGSAMGRGIVTDGSTIWAVGGQALVKIGAEGKLDTAFGKQGVVNPAVNSPGGIARQADGKIVVWSTAPGGKVFRFDPATGAPDATLGGGTGLAGADGFSAAHVTATPDGKLLVTWIDEKRTAIVLERRGADGSIDASFGQGGAVRETLAPVTTKIAERPSSVRLEDGRVALVTSEKDDVVVFLYDDRGVRVPSFGQAGRLSMQKAGTPLAVRAPATVAGKTLFVAGIARVGSTDGDFMLGRVAP